jgi:hypothetical protein
MHARITVAALLLAIAACAPRPVVQSTPAAPTRDWLRSALNSAVLKSNDVDPWRYCLVGTKDCADLSEFATCLLSSGRCNADAHVEYASSESRLRLEPPVAGGANPEIILPIDRQGKGGTRGTVVYELNNGKWQRKGRILNVWQD